MTERRRFIRLFTLHQKVVQPKPGVKWNPALLRDRKEFWCGYGPGFRCWFQYQDEGQWACGVGWFTFAWRYPFAS